MDNTIQKARDVAAIGTIKEMGGRKYIKAATGWKYYGSGKGKKATEHGSTDSKSSSEEGKSSKPAATAEDHAKKTSDEDLKTFLGKEDGDAKLKEVAKKELASRGSYEEDENGVVDVTGMEGEKIPAEEGLPNNESVKESETLAEKNGPAKLSEEKEGFSVKKEAVMTTSDGEDDDDEDDDINHKFEAFGRFAAGVIKGRMKSLIAYGSGGVGKTYTVTSELKKAGMKIYDPEQHTPGGNDYQYVKLTGKMTAAAVYQTMYEHNGKILLFDDCDSVLQDENAINLFKGALDTSGDGSIDWGSQKSLKDSDGQAIPKKFAFEGRAIFISNLDVDGKQKADKPSPIQPIISRGYGINLTMDAQKTIDRIRHIAKSPDGQYTNLSFPGIPDYTHEDMSAVFDYMEKNKDKAGDLNVRTVGTLLAIKKDADEAGVNWEKDARYVYIRKAEKDDLFDGGLTARQKSRVDESVDSSDKRIEKQKRDWVEKAKAYFKDRVTSKHQV